jgi:hypothetical protein
MFGPFHVHHQKLKDVLAESLEAIRLERYFVAFERGSSRALR